uniref:Glyoxylate reductase/hydroxypyruvate reductase n=1 Tax=Globisporangium ultimum (strain ATCC 200006 / CBS 805.95 / DAOM BR144) TaxID=431595 RepID=K3X967_GLOUD
MSNPYNFQKLVSASSTASSVEITYHTSENERIARDELLRQVKGCTGLFCLVADRVDAELLDHAGPSLKVVSTMSVGFNHIDIDACKERNVRVGHTPGVLDVSTAETAIALTFAAKRRVLECAESAAKGEWGTWQPFKYCGTDVSDCTVGVIGLGRIGMTYARMLKFGFNCKIIYTGPREKPEHVAALGGDVEYVDMDTLLARSDIVSMHLPLTDATRQSFNADCFAKMKSDAVFVNTSRGDVVDQEALYDALSTGKIASAGLDVTSPEPLPPTHKLFALPNCVILPHIGSATMKTRRAMADIANKNLFAGVYGHELPHGVW